MKREQREARAAERAAERVRKREEQKLAVRARAHALTAEAVSSSLAKVRDLLS